MSASLTLAISRSQRQNGFQHLATAINKLLTAHVELLTNVRTRISKWYVCVLPTPTGPRSSNARSLTATGSPDRYDKLQRSVDFRLVALPGANPLLRYRVVYRLAGLYSSIKYLLLAGTRANT